MNKEKLLEYHCRALKRAKSKNDRTLLKLQRDVGNASEAYQCEQILKWQQSEIQTHTEAIAFLQNLPE